MITPSEWILGQKSSIAPLQKWQKTIDLMAQLFNAPAAFIVQHTAEGYQVTIASDQAENPYPASTLIPNDVNIFCRKVVENGSSLYVKNATELSEWDDNPEVLNDKFNSYLGLPIYWPDGQAFGTICVMDFAITDYDTTLCALIEQFKDTLQGDLLLIEQFQALQQEANTDELTGLLNRRGFLATAKQRIHLAKLHSNALELVFIDMDGLKLVNDQFGHHNGDRALRCIAKCLQQKLPSDSICSRLGGDEFVVLADAQQRDELTAQLEQLNSELLALFPSAGISYGVISIDDLSVPLHTWIERADKAMYSNKRR
ncbi:MAG: sensor domain-containing diguanylate cyclase [Pseudomonadales bacterium]